MKINALIVDDNFTDAQNIETILVNYKKLDFSTTIITKYNEELILKNDYDIYFLDIDIDDISGLDIANVIQNKKEDAIIIFVSIREDLVFETFKLNTLFFVRKQNINEDLINALNKLQNYFNDLNKTFIIEEIGKQILLKDILYFESSLNYLYVKTKTEEYKIRKTLKSIEGELKFNNFVKVNMSYLINFDNVDYLNGDSVMLKNGDIIPISVRNRQKVKKLF